MRLYLGPRRCEVLESEGLGQKLGYHPGRKSSQHFALMPACASHAEKTACINCCCKVSELPSAVESDGKPNLAKKKLLGKSEVNAEMSPLTAFEGITVKFELSG